MRKYNIAIFHYIANFTDGVSLEMNKWKDILQEMGHKVFLCAGKFGSDEDVLIQEMYHHSPDAHRLNFNTFKVFQDYPNIKAFEADLHHLAGKIAEKIRQFIEQEEINLIIAQNVLSNPSNPAVAIALTEIIRDLKIPCIAHNHDFYFERFDGYALTSEVAAEIADIYLPPRDKLITHVVINSLAQRQLEARKGIHSSIIPNVFDFKSSYWKQDDFNKDFRQNIGLNEKDILILQATRIVTRKGIELAIDLVNALNNPDRRQKLMDRKLYDGRQFSDTSKIVLVLAGYSHDDDTGQYKDRLLTKAEETGIEVLFIEKMVSETRGIRNGNKVYSLWDTYVFADLVTYPSLWEGWGNQFLEAVCAKLPIVLYEYPVYKKDIKPKGFKVISLGNKISGRDHQGLVLIDQEKINAAADKAVDILTNLEQRKRMTDNNYQIAQRYYSQDALYIYIEQFLNQIERNHIHCSS